MEFKKQKLSEVEMGYFITHMPLLGQDRIIAAPEANGPAVCFTPPHYEKHILGPEPGGCMGFAAIPGKDNAFLMITEFYPIFQSKAAGIHLFQAVDGMDKPWTGKRIIDLPFVHRICTVDNGQDSYLIAATVCADKDFQDDWSNPGQTFVAKIPDTLDGPWDLQPIMDPLHRNHGMQKWTFNGKPCVLIAGDEGLFMIEVPEAGSSAWQTSQILNWAISEIYVTDLNGDGQDEIVTIEPFHGNKVCVYKQQGETWSPIFQDELAFGHGLWAGQFDDESVIFVGNRADHKDLVSYRVTSTDPFTMERTVVDKGSGTTNMDVIDSPRGKALLTSNAEHQEYALYTLCK